MLIDFLDEIKEKMTYKEKIKFLDKLEKYPKIKKQILKEINKREKETTKSIERARRFGC